LADIIISLYQDSHIVTVAGELNYKQWQVENTVKLLMEGCTVPFISRYRKEATGEIDEVAVTSIRDRILKLIEIDSRRETITGEIERQGKLTEELKARLKNAVTLTEMEDLYLPYKPKKKTRATVAKEKGLEDLAILIFKQELSVDPEVESRKFLNKNVETITAALQGASDIIAEWISEDKKARESIRDLFKRQALISSKITSGHEEEGEKYRDYFEFKEELNKCPSHRLLAIRRGEKEGFLRVAITIDEESALPVLERIFIKGSSKSSNLVRMVIKDSFKRLLAPSIETEFAKISKESADNEAIKVFNENLQQLLLAPFLGQERVLALDPGYRTGCKLVVLNEQGDLVLSDTIYPNPPQNQAEEARRKLHELVKKYGIEAIAIGNGTASRETRDFVDEIEFGKDIRIFVVSESGASIYSASPVAREEFPDQDVTVRGSISIGRRLMDPLAELVKIDAKNLGVGQYQHDVDQGKLKISLDSVVESCVNRVGVNLNTASRHLLTYVSGLGPGLAANIINFRKENGPFRSREELVKVPRMGEKVFIQCAGFLRIQDGAHPLDNSAVHPESYYIVEKMASDLGCSIADLIIDSEIRKKIKLEEYIDKRVGLPTLNDIIDELEKPGRDPRKKITVFEFRKEVTSIEDVQPGMVLPGIITNLTNFGVFVDIGVKQDGLVHISQISREFIKNPAEKLSLHQEVLVKVIGVDLLRKRIQLSIKDAI